MLGRNFPNLDIVKTFSLKLYGSLQKIRFVLRPPGTKSKATTSGWVDIRSVFIRILKGHFLGVSPPLSFSFNALRLLRIITGISCWDLIPLFLIVTIFHKIRKVLVKISQEAVTAVLIEMIRIKFTMDSLLS